MLHFTNLAVFFNIVQNAFAPPPFKHLEENLRPLRILQFSLNTGLTTPPPPFEQCSKKLQDWSIGASWNGSATGLGVSSMHHVCLWFSDFETFSKNSPSTKVLLCLYCGITFNCNTAVLMKFFSRAYICMFFVIIPNKTYIHYEIFTLFFALEYNKLIFFYFSFLVWRKYFF